MHSLYTFWGKVKKGNQRGRVLGFPTANVALHKNIPSGIYASLLKIEKETFPSITFIGNATSFHEKLYQSETYILSFSKDIYGKRVSISLLKKLRENEKFADIEALKAQMEKDKKAANAFFDK